MVSKTKNDNSGDDSQSRLFRFEIGSSEAWLDSKTAATPMENAMRLIAFIVFFPGAFAALFGVWFVWDDPSDSVGWWLLLWGIPSSLYLFVWIDECGRTEVWRDNYRRVIEKARTNSQELQGDIKAAKSTHEKEIAEIKGRCEAQVAEVKAAEEKLLVEMRKEMKTRDKDAAAKYERLQDEKERMESENEKLTFDLQGVKATLEYYADNARLEVYSGKDALRECGGIYVIKNTGDGKVKIGITDDNFKRRFGEIQSHCASAGIKKEDVIPEILVPLDEGLREVEQGIHRALGKSRTAGEWFGISPEKAVAIVLAHVHKKQVSNFMARTKLPVGEGGGNDDSA